MVQKPPHNVNDPLAGPSITDYDQAKEIAHNGAQKERCALATRQDLQPEILYFLADDPDPEVRRLLATNPAAPRHADLVLAQDKDEKVRGGLAAKMAELAPGLSAFEADKIGQLTYQALELLARDQVVRVRQILAEALKDIADAPAEVIRHLAEDAELVVASPILQFSPVLSDEDLLDIISKNTNYDRLGIIAQRQDVGNRIGDAIIDSGDVESIALLLANDSAQLREEALDNIIDQAADKISWHKPLVNRSFLPDHAALKLAQFVADNLINSLLARDDLSADTLLEVRAVVNVKLQETSTDTEASVSQTDYDRTPAEIAFEKATSLREMNNLSPADIMHALKNGDDDFTIASLAVRSELHTMAVRKTIADKNIKGLLSIAWAAGLSAAEAAAVQRKLAKLPENRVIDANPQGDYTLSDGDMEWQLEFVRDRG